MYVVGKSSLWEEIEKLKGKVMAVVYQAEFHESSFTRIMPDDSRDTCPINEDETSQLENTCRDFTWNRSLNVSREIGRKLFDLLNGDRQTLIRALNEAEACSEKLQLVVKGEGSAAALPFELIYHDNNFLVPSQVHLIRRVSERGKKSQPVPENRPVRLLLMACSPLRCGIEPSAVCCWRVIAWVKNHSIMVIIVTVFYSVQS